MSVRQNNAWIAALSLTIAMPLFGSHLGAQRSSGRQVAVQMSATVVASSPAFALQATTTRQDAATSEGRTMVSVHVTTPVDGRATVTVALSGSTGAVRVDGTAQPNVTGSTSSTSGAGTQTVTFAATAENAGASASGITVTVVAP